MHIIGAETYRKTVKRLKDNIKICLREIGCEDVWWMKLVKKCPRTVTDGPFLLGEGYLNRHTNRMNE